MALRILLFLLVSLLVSSAYATEYATANLENFAHTLVRFNAIDLSDDALLDEYAMITDCDIVENFYGNDFKWSQIRTFVRDSIKMHIDTYPTAYRYDTELQLDRYDFKDKNFRFTDDTAVQAANTFHFSFESKTAAPICNGRDLKYVPRAYDIVIGSPVSIRGLLLNEVDAKALLQRIEESNKKRIIYASFNMTVVHIDPLRKSDMDMAKKYIQTSAVNGRGVRLDGRLDSVQFYEDPK